MWAQLSLCSAREASSWSHIDVNKVHVIDQWQHQNQDREVIVQSCLGLMLIRPHMLVLNTYLVHHALYSWVKLSDSVRWWRTEINWPSKIDNFSFKIKTWKTENILHFSLYTVLYDNNYYTILILSILILFIRSLSAQQFLLRFQLCNYHEMNHLNRIMLHILTSTCYSFLSPNVFCVCCLNGYTNKQFS